MNVTFVVKKILESREVISNEKITLTEGDKIVKDAKETAQVLKYFFSNIIRNLDIAQFNSDDPICEKVINPVIRAIVRHRKYHSILTANRKCDSKLRFDFQFIDSKNILKEIKNLSTSKAMQKSDIHIKEIKDNFDIFVDFIIFFIIVSSLKYCRKAEQKLNALSGTTPSMGFTKKRTLVHAFFLSQFNYCVLICMCHNRMKNKINRLHERSKIIL